MNIDREHQTLLRDLSNLAGLRPGQRLCFIADRIFIMEMNSMTSWAMSALYRTVLGMNRNSDLHHLQRLVSRAVSWLAMYEGQHTAVQYILRALRHVLVGLGVLQTTYDYDPNLLGLFDFIEMEISVAMQMYAPPGTAGDGKRPWHALPAPDYEP